MENEKILQNRNLLLNYLKKKTLKKYHNEQQKTKQLYRHKYYIDFQNRQMTNKECREISF